MTWGTPVEQEIRNRVRVAVAAYAYEIQARPIMSDAEYDSLARSIQPRRMTGHPLYDEFFLVHFSPHTGMWVHNHPEPARLKRLADIARKAR